MDPATILPDDPARGGDRRSRLLSLRHEPDEVARLTRRIYDTVLERSETIRAGNFTVISVGDLQMLFELADAAFFGALLGTLLREDQAVLTFRLSPRMTRVGGTTTVRHERGQKATGTGGWARARYEIAVSTVLLFHTFRHVDRPVTVGGLACRDRLEALQRIFEHELLHLVEFLAWGRSSCSEENFHRLSRQIFAHEGARHDLVTPREVAAATYNVRVGDRVSFEHEGVRRVGRINRITRRATVLVEDPGGDPFSDGKQYATFYVPVARLRKEGASG